MFYYLLAWAFVWMVTFLDTAFAWVHRQTFAEWEMNPVAVAISDWGGIHGVVGFRLLTVACSCLVVSLARKQFRNAATGVVTLAHAGLLSTYIVGFMH